MGYKERREREKAQIRSNILDAAVTIAGKKGWEDVTIRGIAECIEFSPAAIYEHFDSKRGILSEVVLRGMRDLLEDLRRDKGLGGRKGLAHFVDVLWKWAFENPMVFQLSHTGSIFEFGTANTPREARELFGSVRAAVAAVVDPRRKRDLDDLTDVLWAGLSGLILLTMFGRVAGGEARAKHLRDQLLADLEFVWSLKGERKAISGKVFRKNTTLRVKNSRPS
jgi:AcrR family transcriptional regulator